MRFFRKSALILLLPLMAFATVHEFYLSVTHIDYSEKDDALQITARVFIDDLEKALQERYGEHGRLATESESPRSNALIEKYFKAKFSMEIDRKQREFDYLGKEYDTDMVICYLEIPNAGLAKAKTVQVKNEILTDVFDNQQNIVHFKIIGKRKSFVLVKGNDKGTLNL